MHADRAYGVVRLVALVLAVSAAPTAAEPVDPAKAFGAREDIQNVSIAPDGARVAFVRARGARGQVVTVVALDGSADTAVLASDGDVDAIRGCRWSAATRVVCTFVVRANNGTPGYSRMIAVDADGRNMKLLSARTSSQALAFAQDGGTVIDWLADGGTANEAGGSVLMTRSVVPEQSTGTLIAETRQGLAVERVDTLTLKRSLVEPPHAASGEFITDGHGAVRVMGVALSRDSGYDAGKIVYSYRAPGDRAWRPLSTLVVGAGTSRGFEPEAVDRDLNVVYGFDGIGGRKALFRLQLDGSLKRELVYANPTVDVDDLIRIGRQNRVVGATFVTERRQSVFFDPELQKLSAALSKAIPGLPLVTFVDASADETKLVLFAGSDVDPGRYYLYDKGKRTLGELLPVRPQLAGMTLAAVTAVSFPAADGTVVPAYLTLPPGATRKGLPAIVMPHGGPGARDEWGFDWLAQYFANRGYAVLQPNFRGSTGYGNAWFEKNGFQSWRTAIGDVDAGGRWLVREGIAAPAKLAILGWSYGGYAALQSAVLDPDLFKAIVAIAPVTDLETLRGEARNFTNFPQVDAFIGEGPHLRDGSPAQNVAAFRAPVLLFHGDRDTNVGVGESRLMASRLKAAGKPVDYVEFAKLDHQLADDAVRAAMLAKADAFLRTSLGL